METMRYQENKKSGKWPIIAFLIFVIVGSALIVVGIANEDNPQIVGSVREEVQSLVDIYSEETMNKIEEEKVNIKDITFKIEDETITDETNKNFTANIVLPKVSIMDEELTSINLEIKDKFSKLFESLKSEMTDVKNPFTFKTTYKYYDNIIGDKRILSITIHQRIVDDKVGTTTTDKILTYNIDLSKKDLVDESDMALVMFGKDYKTTMKNAIKNYVVDNNMMEADKYTYALTGLENYYIKEGVFHIIFNEAELVDKKFKVIDIKIEKEEQKEEVESEEKESDDENNNEE